MFVATVAVLGACTPESSNRKKVESPVQGGSSGQGVGAGPVNSEPVYQPDFKLEVAEDEIKVATYNVLNLFDTEHDDGKDDYTFLPKGFQGKEEACRKQGSEYYKKLCLNTDWTEDKLQIKLKQIKKALATQGSLPDVLSVQEIENANVAQKLADVLGYEKFLITNSPDNRGIDVAIFYNAEKLRLLDHSEIVLKGPDFEKGPTRNILRAHFAFEKGGKSQVLGVYANHWPSQAAPAPKRHETARQLQPVIEQQTKAIGTDRYYVVVLGDFNTLPEEVPNAFHLVMQNPAWANALVDVQETSFNQGNPMRKFMPPNSYWYVGSHLWEKLDRILVSKNLLDKKGTELLPKTFRIVADPALMKPFKDEYQGQFFSGAYLPYVAKGFDSTFQELKPEEQGFSDHLPLVVKLKVE